MREPPGLSVWALISMECQPFMKSHTKESQHVAHHGLSLSPDETQTRQDEQYHRQHHQTQDSTEQLLTVRSPKIQSYWDLDFGHLSTN